MKNVRWSLSATALCVLALSAYGCSSDPAIGDDDDDDTSSSSSSSSSGKSGSGSSSGGKSSSGGSSSGGKSSSGGSSSSSSSSSGGSSGGSGGLSSSGGVSSGGLSSGGITVPDGGPVIELDAGGDGGVDDAGVALSCPGNLGPVGYNLGPTNGSGDCTLAQINGFRTACIDAAASGATCDAFIAANGVCSDCILPNETDFGALVFVPDGTGGSSVIPNLFGCYSKVVGADAACFTDVANYQPCLYANCQACADDATFDACVVAADADPVNGCKIFSDSIDDCLATITAPEISICRVENDTFAQRFSRVAGVLCGP